MGNELARAAKTALSSTRRHGCPRSSCMDITGILKNHDSPLIEINSVRNLIHLFFAQSSHHGRQPRHLERVRSSDYRMGTVRARLPKAP